MNTDVIYLQPKVNMYFFGKSRDITPKQIKLTIMVYFLDHIYRIMNLTKEFSGKEENVLAVNSKSMFIVQYNILNKTKKKKTNVHIDFL
jgi:hypothetical protein